MSRNVQYRFPYRKAQISRLYLRDVGFRTLCHDHGICTEEYERLNALPSEEGIVGMRNQFAELRKELELEIVEYLDRAELPRRSQIG